MAPADTPRTGMPRASRLLNNVIVPILAVATPILVALLTWQVDDARQEIDAGQQRLSAEIARVDQELKRLEADRLERESLQNYNIIVLKEVKDSLARDDPVVQKVVIGLLQSMPNQSLAQTWLEALEDSENTSEDNKIEARNARQAIVYDVEQKQVAASPVQQALAPQASFQWEDYDYDIFWCEDSPQWVREIADKIAAQMTDEGAKGRLRVRMLPVKVNLRAGYGIQGYAIQANSNEQDQAQALKKIGDQVIGPEGSFQIGASTQETPYYLSAFLCPR